MRISVVIPALNEAESIGKVLEAIDRQQASEILVADGGSTDRTVEIARASGAQVVQEARQGYGRACASGIEAASGEIVVFLDADGADDPTFLAKLAAPVRAGQVEMVLGSRLSGTLDAGAMPGAAGLDSATQYGQRRLQS